MTGARRLIFTKGTDSHDYKFSSAALEDFYHVSPRWQCVSGDEPVPAAHCEGSR